MPAMMASLKYACLRSMRTVPGELKQVTLVKYCIEAIVGSACYKVQLTISVGSYVKYSLQGDQQ
jgi:hypothetical protein